MLQQILLKVCIVILLTLSLASYESNKNLCRRNGTTQRVLLFITTKVTFKITQGHWYLCHSVGHTGLPISLPL